MDLKNYLEYLNGGVPCASCGKSLHYNAGGNTNNTQGQFDFNKHNQDFLDHITSNAMEANMMNDIIDHVNIAEYASGGQWLQKASKSIKRKGTKGAFTEYCGGKVTDECIRRGLNSPDSKIRKRAAFAKAMRTIARNKKQTGGDIYSDLNQYSEVNNDKYIAAPYNYNDQVRAFLDQLNKQSNLSGTLQNNDLLSNLHESSHSPNNTQNNLFDPQKDLPSTQGNETPFGLKDNQSKKQDVGVNISVSGDQYNMRPLLGLATINKFLDKIDERKQLDKIRSELTGSNLFAADSSQNRGDYTVNNGYFRPDQYTYAQKYDQNMEAGGNWIQKANESMKRKGTEGAFTEYCGGKVTNECIERGLNSPDATTRKRAAFAKAMRHIAKRGPGGIPPVNISNIPTAQDSAQLANNSRLVQQYYFPNSVPDITNYEPNQNSRLSEVAYEQFKRIPPIGFTDKGKGLININDYHKEIDKNKYYQREAAYGVLDTRSPMQLYDRRIKPTGYLKYENTNPNSKLKGDRVRIDTYDVLRLTPWQQLSKEDKITRINKFGTEGTPYKSSEEALRSINTIRIQKPIPTKPKLAEGEHRASINIPNISIIITKDGKRYYENAKGERIPYMPGGTNITHEFQYSDVFEIGGEYNKGEELNLTSSQIEDLKLKGYKFEII